MLDTAIIGGGPAALSAALYLARGGKKVEVFERSQIGGDLNQIPKLENYPGYDGSGEELAKAMRTQAEEAGAKISYGECSKVEDCAELIQADEERATDLPKSGFRLTIDDEPKYARTVLVACGAEPRKLKAQPQVPISYCALCDAEFAKDKRVAVIGGADSAVQEALYLAPMVKELTLITHSHVKARAELQKRLREIDNVKILENLEPSSELLGKFEYVFVFIGKTPNVGFLSGLQRRHVMKKDAKFFELEVIKEVDLVDENGYIVTGLKGRTEHETDTKGLYAAGDIRQGAVCQVVTAAGDGAAAAIEILDFLNALQG